MTSPGMLSLRRTILSSAAAVLFLLTASGFAQQSPPSAATPEAFAGTWHWIFEGKPFATMILEPKADGVAGSITGASIHTDANGRITEAFAGTGTYPILRSSINDGVLHVVCKDDGGDEIEWAVRLTSPAAAEVVPYGSDAPKMEPIHAEKAP